MSESDAPDVTEPATPRNRLVEPAVAGLLLLLMLACLGFAAPGHAAVLLAVGWVRYLSRVLPEVEVAWSGVATAAASLAALVVGLHLLGRWWTANTGRTAGDWPVRRTAVAVGLVGLMFVAGLAATAVAHQTVWLVTSPEPVFSRGTYEPLRRSQSWNNLKQIGLALHNYHDIHAVLPPGGTFDGLGRPHHSWLTMLLPYVESSPLYGSIDRRRPWNHPANTRSMRAVLPFYLIPGVEPQRIGSDPLAPGAAHYAANSHVFGVNDGTALTEIADGTANTLLAGEAAGNFKAWGDPTNVRDPLLGINRSPDGFGGPWKPVPGGVQFLMADGSTRFVSPDVDPEVLRAIATPAGGEPVAGDF